MKLEKKNIWIDCIKNFDGKEIYCEIGWIKPVKDVFVLDKKAMIELVMDVHFSAGKNEFGGTSTHKHWASEFYKKYIDESLTK